MTTQPPHSDPAPGYPVILDVAGRRCLVVGGGPVAARRARGLVASGARVTVVAPEVVEAIDRLAAPSPPAAGAVPSPPAAGAGVGPGTLEIAHRPYEAGEAARYHLVVTATGVPGVDRAVVTDATAAGVPVNSADRDAPGTVQLPAVHRDGPVVVAVSTGGASPALARWLRDRIAGSLPSYVTVLCDLLDEARTAIRTAGRTTDSVDWEAVISDLVVPLVESGRIDEARSELLARCRPTGDDGSTGSR
ncbi:MAG: bifunctional precorrin-2 dehydrogenase/sirohydrochlorin ferrochelatase [Acidimicrobiales bacterium]